MQDNIEPMFADNRQANRINVERLLSRLVDYWPSIAISVAVALIFAFGYLRYATPQYLIKAKVLIKSEQGQGVNGALLEELGMGNSVSNIENEVEIFKSRLLMQRVVAQMDLNIQYFIPGAIKTSAIYNDGPFLFKTLIPDTAIKAFYSYTLKPLGRDKFELANEKKTWQGKYGDTLQLPVSAVVIERNLNDAHIYNEVEEYIINITPVEDITESYLSSLGVELINRQINIINLSIRDEIPQRGEDILQKLIQQYQEANIEDKNEVANGTIRFIEDRLGLMSDELTSVEKSIENFKSRNRLTDIEAQSRLLLDNTGNTQQELTQKEVQLRVLESLEKYVQNSGNNTRVMPATLIAQDATLVNIISDYNNLQTQRQRLLMSFTESSPQVKNVEAQLEDLRIGIRNYITSLKKGYQISVNELKSRADIIDNSIRAVPSKERESREYARQQAIKQELYLFLLKKREEAAISKSATVSNLKVIDPAKQSGRAVFPVKSKIYLIALVIGLVIPGVRILLKELFNNRVKSRSDVESGTSIPILGEITSVSEEQVVVVKKDARTVVAEQFRALRTNIQFMLTDDAEKTILITSSMSGEGKSFISINLSSTLALSGKKVILLELDLRKPKVAHHLHLNNQVGFSNYVIGKANLNDVIVPSGVVEGFDVMPSGPVPPNPAELIMLPKTEQLIADLKTKYDYIVIDTAPIGLVTDAQLLAKNADAVIYILRQGYTYYEQLKSADELYKSGKMKHMGMVINDVELKRGNAYGYGKYGSGYYDEPTTASTMKLKKLIKRK
ncbi:MAG TPA: polysaccharide biosynthesis tyrosine autokinase [Flavipsychrobacter sp.]|nr:polysaccharide biosynthesis tyrosine autokinase [Flavipsychrobacter sp.]